MMQQQLQEQLTLQVPKHDQVLYGLDGPVSSITLVSSWTAKTTAMLKVAVQRVVDANPLLSGALEKRGEDLFVVARKHKDFVIEIDGPSDFVTPTGTVLDATNAVQAELEPLFAPHTMGNMEKQVETAGRLFQVFLMKLPSDAVAYVVELTHLLGDGYTYYQLLRQINSAVNGEPLPTFKWSASPEAVALPTSWSAADKDLMMSGWIAPYIENCAKWTPGTKEERKAELNIIHPESAASLKDEFKARCEARGVPFVSTNDLITAGLAELCDEGSIVLMYANLRGRIPEAPHEAGTYERGIGMPARECCDPTFIRGVMKDWLYFGTEGRPGLSTDPDGAMAKANFAVVTNWSSLTYVIEPPQTSVVCHCPTAAFVTGLAGIDVSVIFKADTKGTIALLTNHTKGYRGTQIADRVSASKIFKRLIAPPEKTALPQMAA